MARTILQPMPTDPTVEAWFAELVHPMKAVMLRVREVVLAADPRITETMKWKSPTFMYGGNLASIDPHAKRWVSVLFHRGAEIPGEHPILEGEGRLARYARFDDIDSVEAGRPALEAVVRAWCDSRS
jgi:hypothetical protein